ncbi:ECF RNA polymerase sigma factor SigE [Bremerella volcania]|uniref:ECF RNA polymerase sigma factor SigE n=1 Tax=Bremerella volcania TaxID=2527984 RepID=A0A518C7V9_9BACT|nr:sigma-70 family RNA polymerase sigma factor [Bremerella volcania]QDU75315.1 ECF RNA polymerase sigma factor SigE [Bremerella volcania]
MNETSLSLLHRLRHASESDSWTRLVDMYAPLIRAWLRKYDVQESDAEDLVQEVLVAVSKDVSNFEHKGQPGAFRAWLKGILVNRLRNFWRTRDRRREARGESDLDRRLAELESPTSELSRLWNDEHDRYVLKQLLILAKPHFTPTTWTAFDRVALRGESPRDVASEMQISLNAVITAKSRVLRRLRLEADGLVDSYSDFKVES